MLDKVISLRGPRQRAISGSAANLGASLLRPMPRFVWWCWVCLCIIILLNGNSIAVLTGMEDQIFSLPAFVLSVLILFGLCNEFYNYAYSPANWTMFFACGFLSLSLVSAPISSYVDLSHALGTGIPRYCASLLLLSAGFLVSIRAYGSGYLDAQLKLLFWLTVISSTSGKILSMFTVSHELFNRMDSSSRQSGIFGNVNQLGLQSGYPLIFGLCLSIRTGNVFWMILGLIAGATGVISSFSKAAFIMFMLLMFVIIWEGYRREIPSKVVRMCSQIMALMIIGLVVCIFIYIKSGIVDLGLGHAQIERIDAVIDLLTEGKLDDNVTTGRTSIWLKGYDVWMSSPLIGCGLTSFDIVPGTDACAHNSFLVIIGESGLLGLSLFGAMIFAWFTSIWHCRQISLRVLGRLFLFSQLPLWMSCGQAMSLRCHSLITGCVLGLLIISGRKSCVLMEESEIEKKNRNAH